ncbi:MAG: histidinol-phosphate transaminase [gamma proteobacterium symbiont of Bathyaustriella thionipta]|nr:histidinol-phosphate transaminase [gamma proteobacterium symbiont of Bathyaustriella thionipta]
MSFLQHTAPGIAGLHPYVPGKPISELERELGIHNSLKLASNENPLGCSPAASAAAQAALNEVAFYPDGGGFALKAALAQHHKLAADGITLGNGSNDVLDLIARTFLSPGFEAVFSQHAFAVYAISTQAVGAVSRVAAADSGFGHDLSAMLALVNEKTRVIFIANPNNPTGTWLKQDDLLAFLQKVPAHVVVVIDEAYFEYVGLADYPDASLWLSQFDNLIVTRTFSKAHGLAGLRIGYGLSSAEIAGLLNRVRQPFNVNSIALAAAEAALADTDFIQRSKSSNSAGLEQLSQGFDKLSLRQIPSVGNFITLLLDQPVAGVNQKLLQEGVICRPVDNYGLNNGLRISVGVTEQNQRLLETLARVLAK